MSIEEYNKEYKRSLQLNKPTEEFKKILEDIIKQTSHIFGFSCYLVDCRRFAMEHILNEFQKSDLSWNNIVRKTNDLISERWKQTSSFRMRPIKIEKILETL